jgi:CDP-diacylglycerol--inositol 3-phosphatidyltransferase
MALTFYGLSCILDVFDGVYARYFDQCTQFGAVLDMITDRCTTTFLFFSLASSFPERKIWFQVFCALDWVSHYVHMRATATSGKSHKSIEAEQSWTMSLYYTNKVCPTHLPHRRSHKRCVADKRKSWFYLACAS